MKERRNTEVEEWRDTVVAEGGVTQKTAAGPRSSEAEGDLFVSEVGVHQKDTEEGSRIFGQVKTPPQTRRAVKRAESAEAQHYVSALPLTSHMDQMTKAEDEKNMEDLSFVPSAVSEPRWALHMCDNRCREKDFKFIQIAPVVTEGRRRSTHNQLVLAV